ncbi:MAG: hypothetical protein EVB11_12865, partial [Winogradskyella sp.]
MLLFSWSGFSQNLFVNPGLDQASANCTGADAARDEVPDSWVKTFTPDRSTEQERAWDGTTATRGPSPSGGCYYGFRALGGNSEGIAQDIVLVGGETYNFSWDYLIETVPLGTSCTPQLEIILDGTIIATPPPPPVENVWTRPSITFSVPTSGTYTFEFFAGGACSSTWNFVDDLSI